MNLPLIKLSAADRHFFYLSYYPVVGVMIYILVLGYLVEEMPKLVIMIPATLCATWLFFVLLFGKRDPEGRKSVFTEWGQKWIVNSFPFVGFSLVGVLLASIGMNWLPNLWITTILVTGLFYLALVNLMEALWKKHWVDSNE